MKDDRWTKDERTALEWIVCIPWIGGREINRCPVCRDALLSPDDIKASRFGHYPDIVHIKCWSEYEARFV